MQLMTSIALPILTYSIEALSLNKTQLGKLGHPWERTFMKLFSTFDNSVIKQCQFYTNVLPTHHYYMMRKISFLQNLKITNNQVLQTLHDSFGNIKLQMLASMLACDAKTLTRTFRAVIRKQFRLEAGI